MTFASIFRPVPERSDRRSPSRGVQHLIIECVSPEIDSGRFPVKRIVGDVVAVAADVIKDGHDILSAHIVVRAPGEAAAWPVPMRYDFDADRWHGQFTVDRIGKWSFTIEAWTDQWETWRSGFRKKVEAGQNVRLELLEAAALGKAASRRAKPGPARAALTQTARSLELVEDAPDDTLIQHAQGIELAELMRENFVPRDLTRYGRELEIIVDRDRAGFASWYEFFPRSTDPS